MIRIQRGPAPPVLAGIRAAELRRVRDEIRRGHEPEIGHRYNHPDVRAALLEAQNHTCCYCEFPIQQRGTPIEHHRPKKRAIRGRGLPARGYFWLTWDWENLLLACTACNLTKGDKFPLSPHGGVLRRWAKPPGPERPRLIDPAAEDPVQRVRFVFVGGRWRPIQRRPNLRAKTTIRCIGLDAPPLLEKYDAYVSEHIEPLAREVKASIGANDTQGVRGAWREMKGLLFSRTAPFKALAYDVLDARFPRAERAKWKIALPRP